MNFSVSVIIPVYNAAGYISEAVESALIQPETAEVILVEDCSPDNSLDVCTTLAEKFEKVRLYQHPNGINRGAGPSRNLGMEKSTCPYIAFLDADDFYLPGRFTVPRQIFTANPDCDGVYEAVGIDFEDEAGKERWLASNMASVQMTTMNRYVHPEALFRVLMKGGSGHIHLNGLVIKRSILEKSGYMNEAIADTLHEDTDFILKVAAVGRLLPGRIDTTTSMRRVHAENRVSAPRSEANIYRDQIRLRVATYRWCKHKGLKEQQHLAFRRMLGECARNKPLKMKVVKKMPKATKKTARLLLWPFEVPCVVLEGYYWIELLRSIWGIIKNPSA
jgi:GT2 family glycosyltransferase